MSFKYRFAFLVALLVGIGGISEILADTVQVEVGNNYFAPQNVTIKTGDTVRWVWNSGNRQHSVTSDDGLFDSGIQKTPYVFTYTFDSPGFYRYYCIPHGGPGGEGQAGTVTVEAPVYELSLTTEPTGVQITATPPDKNGQSSGVTPFSLLYEAGTQVSVTAPQNLPGKHFDHWEVDGTPQSGNPVVIQMNAAHSAIAKYTELTHNLMITSVPSGAEVSVDPWDRNGSSGGATPLSLQYVDGTFVQVTASATAGDKVFEKWLVDGVENTTNPVTLGMTADHSLEAWYKTPPPTVRTIRVDSMPTGVIITVQPTDNTGQGDGTTPFQRSYNNGVTVTLTAPTTAQGKVFSQWMVDGQPAPTNPLNLTISADHQILAEYVELPPVHVSLGVASNPSGVAIQVSPPDVNGKSDGIAPFQREYDAGTQVTLIAPETAQGKNFEHWVVDGNKITGATVLVSMSQNRFVSAEYATPPPPPPTLVKLGVTSEPAGVPIQVAPKDRDGNGDGTTPFVREYEADTTVTLTAPQLAGTKEFDAWEVNGARRTGATLQLALAADTEAKALYRLLKGSGDVNNDGAVTTADAQMVLDYLSRIVPLTAEQTAAADVNGDGVLNARDAILILRKIARKNGG